jgi:TolA-binding protein
VVPCDTGDKPACGAGLSFTGFLKRLVLPAGAITALGLSACGGGDLYSRYELEKKFFSTEQAWSKAELQKQSGQAIATSELSAQFETVLEAFSAARPGLNRGDSLLFGYAARAAFRLVDLYAADRLWQDAARFQEFLAADTLFPLAVRHRALYGWAESCQRLGQAQKACALFRQLAASFYPPWAEGGINVDVLRVPARMVGLAQRDVPESVAVFLAFGESYYDGLAVAYPHTELAYQALGELAKLYGQAGRWGDVLTTLGRATDTAGVILPAYRIDQGEILAGPLKDTAGALLAFSEIARSRPTTPFRVDADLKTAAIWLRRGRYADVQRLLQETKKQFPGRPEVEVAVGPMLARSFAASGDKDRARAEYSYLVTSYPRSLEAVEAAFAIAEMHFQATEADAAAEWYARGDQLAVDIIADRESSPELAAAAMNMRVSLAVQLQHWDDAAMRLSEIAQAFGAATPAGASALEQLGWLQLQERHDTLAAGQAWYTLLREYPGDPGGATLRAEMNKWPERYKENVTP